MKIKNLKISYQEIIIPVTHTVYQPLGTMPGLLRITYHLHDKNVIIQRNYRADENRLFWIEVDKGETELAKTLGGIYDLFFRNKEMFNLDIAPPVNKKLAFKS